MSVLNQNKIARKYFYNDILVPFVSEKERLKFQYKKGGVSYADRHGFLTRDVTASYALSFFELHPEPSGEVSSEIPLNQAVCSCFTQCNFGFRNAVANCNNVAVRSVCGFVMRDVFRVFATLFLVRDVRLHFATICKK